CILPTSSRPSEEKLFQKFPELRGTNDRRFFVLPRATEPPAEVWYQRLNNLGLTFTGDYRKSLRAMGRLRKNERDRAVGRFAAATRLGSAPDLPEIKRGVLSYDATEKLLRAYNIQLAPAVMAQSVREAVNAAEKLGYPCVLKVASVDIPHKTEFGALRLGLENKESV